MQPAGFSTDLDVAEVTPQRFDQVVAPFPILRAHPHDVGRITAAADHRRQRRLLQPGTAAVQQRLGPPHSVHQSRRHDHVPKTQPRPNRLRERAHVNGVIRRIRCDGLRRTALIAEVAPMIVFENDAVPAARPGRDLLAPRRRQGVPGGVLMRWSHIQQCSRTCRQLVGNDPGVVHGDRTKLGTRRLERGGGAAMTRCLYADQRTRRDQQARGEGNRLGGSIDNDDLSGFRDDAARRGQMIADRRAQGGQAEQVTLLRQTQSAPLRQTGLQRPSPGLQRE